MTQTVDEAKLGEFMGQMVGYMTGGAMCFGVWLGDELGLYRVLTEIGPATADEVAGKAGCNARLTREWLDGQVAGGLVGWDASTDRYELTPEAVLALADDNSPAFVARGMNAFASMFIDMPKIADAFRGDGTCRGVTITRACSPAPSGSSVRATARSCPTGSPPSTASPTSSPPAAPSPTSAAVTAHRSSCLRRRSRRRASRDSTSTRRRSRRPDSRAEEAGVTAQTTFEVADAKGYTGSYDVICFFDCLHDMGDPVGIARYAREHLAEDGTILLVEPFAIDDRAANITGNPMAALLYTASSTVCTPNSLSQEVGLGLGAQAGEARLRRVFEDAGFTQFRRAAETPMNLVLEAKR